jgi:hypothetical protein
MLKEVSMIKVPVVESMCPCHPLCTAVVFRASVNFKPYPIDTNDPVDNGTIVLKECFDQLGKGVHDCPPLFDKTVMLQF